MTKNLYPAKVIKRPRPAPARGAAGGRASPALAYVGARLKEMRLDRGLSQDDLAYGIPCDRSHIGQIENGKAAPTVLTILKLAVALDCEVTDLLPKLADAKVLLRAHARGK